MAHSLSIGASDDGVHPSRRRSAPPQDDGFPAAILGPPSSRGAPSGASRRTLLRSCSQLLSSLIQGVDAEIVDRDTPVDAFFIGRIVAGRLVVRAAIVPDDDVALFPDMVVFGLGRHHRSAKLGDDIVTFRALDAD